MRNQFWVSDKFAPPSHFEVHGVGLSPVICYLNLNQNTLYLKLNYTVRKGIIHIGIM